MVKTPRLYYGWIIVGTSAYAMTLIYGIRHSFSIFFPSILGEFGWTRGDTAIMFSLNVLIYGFLAPIAGSLGDRWKPKKVMLIGLTILCAATASCGFADELWHFYLLFGILAPIGMACSGWPLMTPAIANWFTKKRGFALGLGQTGGGLSFAYSMFSEYIISRLGWRHAYFLLAGSTIVFLVPLYCIFFRYRPEDKGLKSYGDSGLHDGEESTECGTDGKGPEPSDWTLQTAVRTRQFWLIVLSQFLFWGIGVYLVIAHQINFAVDAGYSSMLSSSVFALFGIFMVLGQLSASISDWIGREKTVTIASLLTIGSLLALISVRDASRPCLLYLYATCFGYGTGLYSPTIFASTADIFHGRYFGEISGMLLTGMGLGGAIGPWLGGYIYDISGSYISAFLLSMVCLALASIALWLAAPRYAEKARHRT